MKKLLILLFTVVVSNTNAQKAIEPEVTGTVTTQEEYNYLTKGYKVQIESGLDMKKGYLLDSTPGAIQSGDYTFEFKPLIREQTKEIAAILVVANSKVWGNNTYYFCIPRNNSELTKQYVTDLKRIDSAMVRVYAEICSLIVAEYFAIHK